MLPPVTSHGEPGRTDEPQHRLMGAIIPELLTAMRVRHEVLPQTRDEIAPAPRRRLAPPDSRARFMAEVSRPEGSRIERCEATA